VNLADIRASASGRQSVYSAFVNSAEFLGNPSLKDRASFVVRVYQQLLRRTPTSDEVSQVLQVGSLCFCLPAGNQVVGSPILSLDSEELRRQRRARWCFLDGLH
jgi:hypothetical protein